MQLAFQNRSQHSFCPRNKDFDHTLISKDAFIVEIWTLLGIKKIDPSLQERTGVASNMMTSKLLIIGQSRPKPKCTAYQIWLVLAPDTDTTHDSTTNTSARGGWNRNGKLSPASTCYLSKGSFQGVLKLQTYDSTSRLVLASWILRGYKPKRKQLIRERYGHPHVLGTSVRGSSQWEYTVLGLSCHPPSGPWKQSPTTLPIGSGSQEWFLKFWGLWSYFTQRVLNYFLGTSHINWGTIRCSNITAATRSGW